MTNRVLVLRKLAWMREHLALAGALDALEGFAAAIARFAGAA